MCIYSYTVSIFLFLSVSLTFLLDGKRKLLANYIHKNRETLFSKRMFMYFIRCTKIKPQDGTLEILLWKPWASRAAFTKLGNIGR